MSDRILPWVGRSHHLESQDPYQDMNRLGFSDSGVFSGHSTVGNTSDVPEREVKIRVRLRDRKTGGGSRDQG